MKNPAAVALGKLAKGKPKKFSKAEIKRRTELLIASRRNGAKGGRQKNLKGNQ
jgi:hypothetical protein